MESPRSTYGDPNTQRLHGRVLHRFWCLIPSHSLSSHSTYLSVTPIMIPAADSGMVYAYDSGNLQAASLVSGRECEADLQVVYYTPEIHVQLVSIGRLLSQGLSVCPVGLGWRSVRQYQCGGQRLLSGARYDLPKVTGWTTGPEGRWMDDRQQCGTDSRVGRISQQGRQGDSADLALVSGSSGVQDCSYTVTSKERHEWS